MSNSRESGMQEMKDELKLLNSELEKRNIDPVKRNRHANLTWNKAAYASFISAA